MKIKYLIMLFFLLLLSCKAPILKDYGGETISSSQETVPIWLKGFQDKDSTFFYFYVQKDSKAKSQPNLKRYIKQKLSKFFIKRIQDLVAKGEIKISQTIANNYLLKMPTFVIDKCDKDLFYWREIKDGSNIFFDHYYVLRISKKVVEVEEKKLLSHKL